jgi:dihydrofolate reductase
MRPLLLNVAVTLDGYIEGPNGEIDWCLTDQDYGMTAFLERCDGLLMGRKSYEALLTYDANAWPDKERYVFSRTLKEMNGPGRLFGADVLTQCMEAGLVDELVLSIHPLLLGGGVPLHQRIARTPLRLLDNVTYDSGLVQLTYAVVR